MAPLCILDSWEPGPQRACVPTHGSLHSPWDPTKRNAISVPAGTESLHLLSSYCKHQLLTL
ncbi:unnamed protein product, partial [Gulo gulo]